MHGRHSEYPHHGNMTNIKFFSGPLKKVLPPKTLIFTTLRILIMGLSGSMKSQKSPSHCVCEPTNRSTHRMITWFVSVGRYDSKEVFEHTCCMMKSKRFLIFYTHTPSWGWKRGGDEFFFSVPPKAAENVGTCFRRMIACGTNPELCWHPYPKPVGSDPSWILSPRKHFQEVSLAFGGGM